MVSIIVISHGHEADCQILFASLLKHYKAEAFELIVVDNLNHAEFLNQILAAFAVDYPNFKYRLLVNPYPRSFSYSNNLAVSVATHDMILLLNPDIIVEDSRLYDFIRSNELANGTFYYPALLNSDRTPQAHRKAWPSFAFQLLIAATSKLHWNLATRMGNDWAFAAAILFKKTTFTLIGGFDEGFRLYCEDVEICHRLKRLGGSIVFLEDITLIHALGNGAKSVNMRTAIRSNLYLRYTYLRNLSLKRIWNQP